MFIWSMRIRLPRAVALKGLLPGGVVVVIGAGAMGRMHVDLALSYRPRAVIVVDLIEDRLERVRSLFAGRAAEIGVLLRVVNAGQEDPQGVVDELTDHLGADE